MKQRREGKGKNGIGIGFISLLKFSAIPLKQLPFIFSVVNTVKKYHHGKSWISKIYEEKEIKRSSLKRCKYSIKRE